MDHGDVALTSEPPADQTPPADEAAAPDEAPAPQAPPTADEAPAPEAPPAAPSTPSTRTTVARLVAQRLAAAGVRYAFGVPGEGSIVIPAELADAGIRVIATRHEGAASFMAAAAAQLTGRPQVVFTSRTPGAANAAIGIHAARQDSLPVVALLSGVRREHRGREAFQESDLAGGIGSLARWAVELERPGDVGRVLGEGFRQLLGGRPGPIALVLPEDLLGNEVPADGTTTQPASPAAPDRDAVAQAVRWLAASRRGVILAGGGVSRARASKRLLALADELAIPIVASWRRPDVVPNDHPGYLGMTGSWAAPTVRQRLEEADVLLAIGTRLDQVATYGYRIPLPATRFIQVDLEPRAGGRGLRAPDLAIATDASRFLDLAWADLRGKVLDAENRSGRPERVTEDRAHLCCPDVMGAEWLAGKICLACSLGSSLPNAVMTIGPGNGMARAGAACLRLGLPWHDLDHGQGQLAARCDFQPT
ncbi:MAG: thiamine pyrophosphate-binding protein [Chloroflexota bacterium]